MQTKQEVERIRYLSPKIEDKTATNTEIKEYMDILLKNNNISKKQYDDYFSKSSYSEDILKTALIIGGLVLLGYLISQKVE